MTHAPARTCFQPHGDGTIQGCFTHKQFGTFFEFSTAKPAEFAWAGPEFNMKVWVSVLGDGAWRLAKVLKTVAYVIVDEDDYGKPVVEHWPIKKFELYPRPSA